MLYYGELETMSLSKELDTIANLYHKTKDKVYKDLWYKKLKEYANGLNNSKRQSVSTDSSDRKNPGRDSIG
jgi:predicted nucleotide-binding protein (sugar kinase/HSP70/actin superfamily)